MGSFFLVFMYLCSSNKYTRFSNDNAVEVIILAGAYLSAMMLAGTKIDILKCSPCNPAIAFGIILMNSSGNQWKSFYIFGIFSYAGALLALIFY